MGSWILDKEKQRVLENAQQDVSHADIREMYDGDPAYSECIVRLRERNEMEVQ